MKRNIFILLIVASILIVFSTLNFASGTIDESLPSLIKRIKPSTVIIFAYDDKGEFLQLGSGFFISQNGDVITNYHVIQGASSAEIKTANLVISGFSLNWLRGEIHILLLPLSYLQNIRGYQIIFS